MKAFTRKHKALLNFVAKNDTRPILTGIYIQDGIAAAADGFTLLEMPLEDVSRESFPVITTLEDANNVIIQAKVIASAIQNIPTRSTIPATKTAPIVQEDGRVSIITSDTYVTNTITSIPIVGTYPNYKTLIPEHKSPSDAPVVWISRIILQQLATAMRDMKAEYIRFQLGTKENVTVRVEFKGDELEGVVGAIMPCYIKGFENVAEKAAKETSNAAES